MNTALSNRRGHLRVCSICIMATPCPHVPWSIGKAVTDWFPRQLGRRSVWSLRFIGAICSSSTFRSLTGDIGVTAPGDVGP